MRNESLDFLNMIKNQKSNARSKTEDRSKVKTTVQEEVKEVSKPLPKKELRPLTKREEKELLIAVIDTETNWDDVVMSIGVAIGRASDFKCLEKKYYVFDRESRKGGMYSYVLHMRDVPEVVCSRERAMDEIKEYFAQNHIDMLFAYNAKFDYNHLPELKEYNWYDIMRIAAYKQYNHSIPETLQFCKTGRLKSDYGVEPIMKMLSGNRRYSEVHNAVLDAEDELKIVELLKQKIDVYECARIN